MNMFAPHRQPESRIPSRLFRYPKRDKLQTYVERAHEKTIIQRTEE